MGNPERKVETISFKWLDGNDLPKDALHLIQGVYIDRGIWPQTFGRNGSINGKGMDFLNGRRYLLAETSEEELIGVLGISTKGNFYDLPMVNDVAPYIYSQLFSRYPLVLETVSRSQFFFEFGRFAFSQNANRRQRGEMLGIGELYIVNYVDDFLLREYLEGDTVTVTFCALTFNFLSNTPMARDPAGPILMKFIGNRASEPGWRLRRSFVIPLGLYLRSDIAGLSRHLRPKLVRNRISDQTLILPIMVRRLEKMLPKNSELLESPGLRTWRDQEGVVRNSPIILWFFNMERSL